MLLSTVVETPASNAVHESCFSSLLRVTGASQGLGELMSLYLAAQGARLILSARGKDKLEVRQGRSKGDGGGGAGAEGGGEGPREGGCS